MGWIRPKVAPNQEIKMVERGHKPVVDTLAKMKRED